MALSDPQSVTVGTAQTLPRTGSQGSSSTYQVSDGSLSLTVSHAPTSGGKRVRRVARINHSKIAPDVLTNGNTRYSSSVYIVADVPANGYTVAEQKQLIDGLTTWFTASTGANATKFLGGES